jgi:type IV secretion system protein VirB9
MTRVMFCASTAALALLAAPVFAAVEPRPCSAGKNADARVRCIPAQRDMVVRLVAAPGAALIIEVPDGEKVVAVPASDQAIMRAPGTRSVRLAVDDGESTGDDRPTTDGNLSVAVRGPTVVVKPHGALLPQPFFVLTERDGKQQRYRFELETGPDWYYSVRLGNPGAEAAERTARWREVTTKREERAARDTLEQARAEPCRSIPNVSHRYVAQGDAALAPAEICDDGRQTYARFTGRVPVIETTLPDGRLASVNTSPGKNGWTVIEAVAKTFRLMDGGRTLCIHNRGYSATITNTYTGTITPAVVREPRE